MSMNQLAQNRTSYYPETISLERSSEIFLAHIASDAKYGPVAPLTVKLMSVITAGCIESKPFMVTFEGKEALMAYEALSAVADRQPSTTSDGWPQAQAKFILEREAFDLASAVGGVE
jgi:hypothetical protein